MFKSRPALWPKLIACLRSCLLLLSLLAIPACNTAGVHGLPASQDIDVPNDEARDTPRTLAEAPDPIQPAAYAMPQATLDAAPNIPGVPETGKAILVNIPSFELIAFEDGTPVLRSRVIVGKPSTPTPVMETETSVVRFRPTWTPTPRMIASGKYRPGTRPPGKRNPLGFLAIRLAPGMLIYLHGTNKPQLFDREKRALSHGCVRVEKWDEVAAWVLGTTVEDVHASAFGRRTFDAPTDGIPVIITYQTRFAGPDGEMRDWPDVYRRGARTARLQTL